VEGGGSAPTATSPREEPVPSAIPTAAATVPPVPRPKESQTATAPTPSGSETPQKINGESISHFYI
jgi:hypothetical protein